MADFNPQNVQSLAEFKAGKSLDVFRTKDGSRLYAAPKGEPQHVVLMFSKKIQKASDISAETVVGTFLSDANEEVRVAYNPGEGKEAEFSL